MTGIDRALADWRQENGKHFAFEDDNQEALEIVAKLGLVPLTSAQRQLVWIDALQCADGSSVDDWQGYISRLECLMLDAKLHLEPHMEPLEPSITAA